MRQLPAQTSDTPAPRRAPHCRATDPPRCQTFAPRNAIRQTIATDLRRVSEPPPRRVSNAIRQTIVTPPPRRASNPPSITPRVTDHPRKPPNPRPAAPPNASSQVETQKGPTAYYHTVGPSRVVPRADIKFFVVIVNYSVFIVGYIRY